MKKRGDSIGLSIWGIKGENNNPEKKDMSIVLYSTGCPKCMMAEQAMNNKGIEYEIVSDEDVINKIATENEIFSMPFAKVDNDYLRFPDLIRFINGGGV